MDIDKNPAVNILVAHTEGAIGQQIKQVLQPPNWEVRQITHEQELMQQPASAFDLLLVDMAMVEANNFACYRQLLDRCQPVNSGILLMVDLDQLVRLNQTGLAACAEFILQPINYSSLRKKIRCLLDRQRVANALADARQKMEQINCRLAKILDSPANEIYVIEQQSLAFLQVNRAASENLGYSQQELQQLKLLQLASHLTADQFNALIKPLRQGTNNQVAFNTQLQRKDGSLYSVEGVLHYSGQETPATYVVILQDVSLRQQAEAKMRQLAYYDPLTGLPNRTLFQQNLCQQLAASEQFNSGFALLFIDIDHFKRINDTLGHRIGDLLLKSVAERLLGCLRSEEIITRANGQHGDIENIARLGGDEFTILMPDIIGKDSLVPIVQRILQAIACPLQLETYELVITPSIGIALFPQDGHDLNSLLKNADTAMYHAKRQGRNNFQFYNSSFNARALERLSLESELRKAIERQELELVYQPQIDINQAKVVGVEALVRWRYKQQQILLPNRFIPIAEEIGLIIPLGEWVLATACQQSKEWQAAGLPAVKMAVNIAYQQFQHHRIVATIDKVLQQTGLSPTLLEVELTENTIMANVNKARTILELLKDRGIQIAVDDFGTGYSSLSYLKYFPLNTIKIDRTFTKNMLKEKKDLGIVTAIINMAHNLQLSAIVEGVENIQQLSLLEAQQAYLMQGYLFSPPVSAADCACLFAPPFLVDHLHQLAIPDKVNSLSSQGRVLEAG